MTRLPFNGDAEMRQLVLATLAALEQAEMLDVSQLLQERLFCQPEVETLAESYDKNNIRHWRFKPMAELLLLELAHIAEAHDLSPDERRLQIGWTLEMAGF